MASVVQTPGPWAEGTWPAGSSPPPPPKKTITIGAKPKPAGAPPTTALAKGGPLGIPVWVWVLGSLGVIAVVWYVSLQKKGGRAWKSRRPF